MENEFVNLIELLRGLPSGSISNISVKSPYKDSIAHVSIEFNANLNSAKTRSALFSLMDKYNQRSESNEAVSNCGKAAFAMLEDKIEFKEYVKRIRAYLRGKPEKEIDEFLAKFYLFLGRLSNVLGFSEERDVEISRPMHEKKRVYKKRQVNLGLKKAFSFKINPKVKHVGQPGASPMNDNEDIEGVVFSEAVYNKFIADFKKAVKRKNKRSKILNKKIDRIELLSKIDPLRRAADDLKKTVTRDVEVKEWPRRTPLESISDIAIK